MTTKHFNKSVLATSLSLILAGNFAPNAVAQEQQENIEVIEISGIKGSLIKSMDVKRSATGVVDAITAEDIGKFPDANLAESLQRITGVSIDRSNNEGSKVTVRGMGPEFNLVTLNGRQLPTVGGRSFDFANIATEGVSAVEIYKTTKADLPSGGIGATVNMLTARPLTSPGLKASLGVKGVLETSNEAGDDITPEVSGIYSNTFNDDKFGVLLSGSYQDRNNREEKAAIDNWIPNVDLSASPNLDLTDNNQRSDGATWYPQNSGYSINDNERTRVNGQLVLQYAANDDFTATVDYTYSKLEFESNRNAFGVWFNNGGNVKSATINENGTYTNVAEVGGDYATNLSRAEYVNENKSLGLNLQWQASDSLKFELDAHDSSATNKGAGLGNDAFVIIGNTSCGFCDDAGDAFGPNTANINVKTNAVSGSGVPLWGFDLVDGQGNPQAELTGADMGSLFGAVTQEDKTNDMTQFQLKGEWVNNESGFLNKVSFGAARTKMEFRQTTAYSQNLPAGWWNWSAVHFPDDMFNRVAIDGMLDGFSNAGNKPVNYYLTADFDKVLNLFETIEDTIAPDIFNDGWPQEVNGQFQAGPIDNDSRVKETTTSLYTQANMTFDVADRPLNVSVGVRYEKTDIDSMGLERPAVAMEWVNGNEWEYVYASEQSFSDGSGETEEFLPSIDIDYELMDDVIARASYSRSLTRPPIGALGSTKNFVGNPKVGQRKVEVGNPQLKPYVADNYDVSLEYYYDEGSYVSVGYFNKKVDNFLVNVTTNETIEGLRDVFIGPRAEEAREQLIAEGIQPSDQAIHDRINANMGAESGSRIGADETDPLASFAVSKDVNLRSSSLYGWEIALQHMFGDSGFGVQANATMVNGDVSVNRDITTPQFALVGMSDSANLSAIYDKDGLSVRVSYNWRDEFLSDFDQHSSPAFTEAYSQIDVNVNYQVTEQLTVFFEGLNITEETQRVYVRYPEQFLNGAQYGARYNLGARYTF
ncbi:TonB-dependent receptor [Pseudoalteromonas sp. JBTF-M23]|uniref:TonB-dependent receptor n=1 Tax=Pseudoalteromonas caenipelagi TaxID=2726988 RepID=A0A849VBJ6_9GAMM|nr:TonB-dependent receptor [Pseudoalteromonas caenipelagi]NOU49177.1 TonB-dependent receptor [Pseudoalteromonas caenipelagi]